MQARNPAGYDKYKQETQTFKNKKEYKEAKKNWSRNSRMQARSPAGYAEFQSREENYKREQAEKKAGAQKKSKPKSDEVIKDNVKKETKDHYDSLNKMIRDARNQKNEELKVPQKKPLTSKDLPNRPGKPKLPNVTFDSPVFSSKVRNPSKLPGKINRYGSGTKGVKEIRKTYGSSSTGGANSLRKFKQRVKRK